MFWLFEPPWFRYFQNSPKVLLTSYWFSGLLTGIPDSWFHKLLSYTSQTLLVPRTPAWVPEVSSFTRTPPLLPEISIGSLGSISVSQTLSWFHRLHLGFTDSILVPQTPKEFPEFLYSMSLILIQGLINIALFLSLSSAPWIVNGGYFKMRRAGGP